MCGRIRFSFAFDLGTGASRRDLSRRGRWSALRSGVFGP